MPLTFLNPYFLLLTLLVVPILMLRRRRRPALGHSNLRIQQNIHSLNFITVLPPIFYALGIITMSAALAAPAIPQMEAAKIIDSRDIILAVDISTNMTEPSYYGNPVPPNMPTQGCGQGPIDWGGRKIDLAAYTVCTFTVNRLHDRIGLEVFDGNTYWHAPLVSDLNIIQRKKATC